MHAILSPSSAYRWLTCTPSARFEQFQADEDSDFAKEGTLAHEVAGLILESRAGIYKGTHEQFIDNLNSIEWAVDRYFEERGEPSDFLTMLQHAEDYAEFALSFTTLKSEVTKGQEADPLIMDRVAQAILVEEKIEVFDTVPLGFGTSDCAIATKKVLFVIDYKYGAGVRVNAKNNPQGKIYALGSLKQAEKLGYFPETVVISIYQPRAGGSSTWEISTEELKAWAREVVAPQARKAIAGIGEFVAGVHCQFCKARTVCGKQYEMLEKYTGKDDPRKITDEQRKDIIENGDTVKSFINKVKVDTLQRMQRGQNVKGFKLVEGRKTRSFKSEDDVLDALMEHYDDLDQFLETKVIPLTQIEKVLGKKDFERLLGDQITQTLGAPSIVDEDDDRVGLTNGHSDYE